ncbi:hypothetical protein GCM10027053_07960 [Intrasporangium mesophilum]
MPSLGEVIGALLSNVAQARAAADLEAVRIARAYSSDPVMKLLSIPRIRLPEVVVDLPLLIADIGVGEEKAMGWSVAKPTAGEVTKAVRSAMTESRLRLPRPDSASVVAAAVDAVDRVFAEGEHRLLTPQGLATRVADAAVDTVKASAKGAAMAPDLQGFPESAAASLNQLFDSKRMLSPSVEVIVGAEEIRARADSANVVRIRLNVTEDAYEILEEPDGDGFRLTPE